ncbi:MAG: hypothetical protein PHS41_06950 [Victivallaceae bacterium]|nr:hypothetical protein [Victivallaceae bacterium]
MIKIAAPAYWTFPMKEMKRFVYPTQANWSMGICFLPSFFEKRTGKDRIHSPRRAPFNGMQRLFKSHTEGIPNKEFKQKSHVRPTPEKMGFYNETEKSEFLRNLCRISWKQSNPDAFEHKFLCTVNDEKPLLIATQFQGTGYLFQPQTVNQNETERVSLFKNMLFHTLCALKRQNPELFQNKKILFLEYSNMPAMVTGFDPVSLDIKNWNGLLPQLRKKLDLPVEKISDLEALRQALSTPDAIIINPYGNIFPSADGTNFAGDLEKIRSFVKDGGIWWESGARSFDTLLTEKEYAQFDREARYPSAAADYTCVEYQNHCIAIYGIQPTMRFPYDRERAAIPKSYDLRGSADGAKYKHNFVTWIDQHSKQAWNSSPIRVAFGFQTPQEGIAAYEKTLELNRTLADKVKPDILARMLNSVLFCVWHDDAASNMRSFQALPPNNIAHFIGALASRFDANYPEHLPPSEKWGTLEDLRELVATGHKNGHLVMPYTNTTWWLPHENRQLSPSQKKWNDRKTEIMSLNPDGTPSWRRGRTGVGWALNFYHPYVQAASLKVTKDFAQFGCDMVFMDEMGGHPWKYDFNKLEPWPATALDARISMCWDSSKVIPTATEEGHDRLLNFNTLFCGGTWKTFPNRTFETQRYVHQYRSQDWQYWPAFLWVGHDKALFTLHDLNVQMAGFEELSLALSLGYKMKGIVTATSPQDRVEWAYFLDAIQKTVAKEYEGKKLQKFLYPFESGNAPYRNRVVYAEYGAQVRMICNHSAEEIELKNLDLPFPAEELAWLQKQVLPPYGFYGSTANGKCGYLAQQGARFGFALAQEGNAYRGAVFTRSEQKTFLLPAQSEWPVGAFSGSSGKLKVARSDSGSMEFTLPFPGSADKFSWWISNYDPDKKSETKVSCLIRQGSVVEKQKGCKVLVDSIGHGENGALKFSATPREKLKIRIQQEGESMTFLTTFTLESLPKKGIASLVTRSGCNSIFGITTDGQMIFTLWYANRKTNNHLNTRPRLRPGQKVHAAAVIDSSNGKTTIRLILNGKEEAVRTTNQKPFPYGPVLAIGEKFNGTFETLAWASGAMTNQQILDYFEKMDAEKAK